MSPPARGRGLKLSWFSKANLLRLVAPRAGAWIETKGHDVNQGINTCRPPRGGVD